MWVILCFVFLGYAFFLNRKLNKIEDLLNDLKRQRNLEQTPLREHTSKLQPATPPEQQEQTEIPITEKSEPEETSAAVLPEPVTEPTVWQMFLNWLWMGNSRGKENTSREYAIATTWLMRAGVIVLLCGIGFFLKYSIENNLISPTVRICSAYLTGLVLFILGLFMVNKRFHILAVGIFAVGIVTLYMSSFVGYKLYHLLTLELSFGIMVLTTAAAMIFSVRFGLLPSALTGCTGAYLTPVLLSDGSGNIPFLMGYTVVISAGILIISRAQRWRSLEITAFLFSFTLMGYGIFSRPSRLNWWCLGFLFLNFLVFTMIPVIRKKGFSVGKTEWLLPIAATVVTLFSGVDIIRAKMFVYPEETSSACFALLLSLICLGEGLWLKWKCEHGDTLLPAYLCASVFSLVLVFPLAWEEDPSVIITGWSVLGVVLAFASERSRYKTLLALSGLVFTITFFLLISYLEYNYKIFLNRFLSSGMFTISLLASGFFLRKNWFQPAAAEYNNWFSQYKTALYIAGGMSFLWYSSFEVYYNLEMHDTLKHFRHGGLSVWWGILVAVLIIWGIRKDVKALRFCGLLLFAACLGKVYFFDISGLNTLGKVIAFLVLGVLFLGAATAYILYRKRFAEGIQEEKQE